MAIARFLDPLAMLEDEVAPMSIGARLLWSYLPCFADREGRLSGTPFGLLMLKGRVFPCDDVDIGGFIDEMVQAGLVRRYSALGRVYIEIKNFNSAPAPEATEPSVCPADGESQEGFEARRGARCRVSRMARARGVSRSVELSRAKLDRGPSWDSIRRKVLERDQYACRQCSASGRLDVHHKVPLRKFGGDLQRANAFDNLISLCRPCHNRADAELRRADLADASAHAGVEGMA